MYLVNLLVVLALIATMGALLMGVYSLARGGAYDAEHSEQFMYARVGFQGAALALMLTVLYLINV